MSKYRSCSPMKSYLISNAADSHVNTKKVVNEDSILLEKAKQHQMAEIEASMRHQIKMDEIEETKEQQKERRAQEIEEEVLQREEQIIQKQEEQAALSAFKHEEIVIKEREMSQMRETRVEKEQQKTVESLEEMNKRIDRMNATERQIQYQKSVEFEEELDLAEEEFQINREMKEELFEERKERQHDFEYSQNILLEKERVKNKEELEMKHQAMRDKLQFQKSSFQAIKDIQKSHMLEHENSTDKQHQNFVANTENEWNEKNSEYEQNFTNAIHFVEEREKAKSEKVQRKLLTEQENLAMIRSKLEEEKQQSADYFRQCYENGREEARIESQQRSDLEVLKHREMVEREEKVNEFVEKKNQEENELKYELQEFNAEKESKRFNEVYGERSPVRMRNWEEISQLTQDDNHSELLSTVFK